MTVKVIKWKSDHPVFMAQAILPIGCTEPIYNKISNWNITFCFGNHWDIYIAFHLNRKKLEFISNEI